MPFDRRSRLAAVVGEKHLGGSGSLPQSTGRADRAGGQLALTACMGTCPSCAVTSQLDRRLSGPIQHVSTVAGEV